MIYSLVRRGLFRVTRGAAVAAAALLAGSIAAQAESMKIGVSIPSLDNPFWVNAANFAKHVGSELDIEIVLTASESREEKQLADVQSMLSVDIDALVVTPVSTAGAPGLIRLANEADVPVVVVDRHPGFNADNPNAPYVGFLGPNDVTAGRDIAQFLVSKGADKIVGLGGTPGSSVADGREQGLRQGVEGADLVQYVAAGDSEDNGYNAMQNLLAAHPSGSINGVWCFNDALCLGAFRAIKQAGRDSEIMIGGMDLVPQALELIEGNTNYVFSTGGHWLQLGFGVMMAYDKVNGHDPIETDIRLDLLGVNGENFSAFKEQFIDSSPPYDVKEFTLSNNPNATAQQFPLATK